MDIEAILQERTIPHEIIRHPPTDTAAETSAAGGIDPDSMAKVVLLRADHGYEYVIAVVPADRDLDLQKASQALGYSDLALANDDEVSERCPDCEGRILLPFGAAYHLKTLIDQRLAEHDTIAFRSNTRDHSVRMKFADFHEIEKPPVVALSKE